VTFNIGQLLNTLSVQGLVVSQVGEGLGFVLLFDESAFVIEKYPVAVSSSTSKLLGDLRIDTETSAESILLVHAINIFDIH